MLLGMRSPKVGPTPVGAWRASTSTLAQLAALATHSRTSLATMFDSTGKLTYAPNNLLTQSNTFSNAIWAKSGTTVASGATDRFGGTSAWTVTATGANGQLYQGVTGNTSTNYVPAIWVKRRTGTGNIKLYNPSAGAATIIAVDNTWKQFAVPGAGAGSTYCDLLIETSGDAVDISEATLSAVTYETTPRAQDQVITTAAAYYGPRVDYDPNTLAVKGLLIEEARTNRFFPSVGAASWGVTSGNVTLNFNDSGTLAPDGTQTATLMTAAGTNAFWELQVTASTSAVKTSSVWIKRKTGSGPIEIVDARAAAWNTVAEPTGWTRVKYTDIASTLNWGGLRLPTSGDAIWIWGYQIEDGSFATSYIPGAAAAVTRAADALAAALYSSNPSIIQLRNLSTGARSRKKLTTYSSISSEINEWIEAIRVYPVGTSSAYLDAHLTVDGPW